MKSPRNLRRTVLAAAILQALASAAGAADYTWNSGVLSLTGLPDPLLAADTLTINVGGTKTVDKAMTTQGTVTWLDNLYFQYGHGFTNSGTWNAIADVSLLNGYAGGTFNNSGIFRKSGGSGNTSIGSGITFINSGTVDALTGVIDFASGAAYFNSGSQFTGAGTVRVSSNASFNGALTSQNLQLAAGTYSGTGAQINGTVNWVGGVLSGDWQVNGGQTLNLQGVGSKLVVGSVTNKGTMAAQDNLGFQYGHVLSNQGLYDFVGEVGLFNSYAGGVFNNTGTLRKSSGAGTSSIGSGITFTNSGTIEAMTGVISFDSGAATFNDGTAFTGAGQVKVTANATFVGGFTTNSNLFLHTGTFTGGDGSPGSKAVMNGNVNWVTGYLAGNWEVAPGQTLTLAAGDYKYILGSVTNKGTVAATDHLYFQYNKTLTNEGLYDMQGDVGLFNAYAGGVFDNSGTLLKSAGTGTSSIGPYIAFTNSGTIKAQTGTISFDGNGAVFNAGTLFTGDGKVQVTGNAAFNGAFTSHNLQLVSGTLTGSGALMNGAANWTGGTLTGDWTVATGASMNLQPGGTKFVVGSVTNQGTMAATDHLYFQYNKTLTNEGLYDMQGDVGLFNAYAGGVFDNSGTLLKSAGTGTSSIGLYIAFNNSGTIKAQTGTISFDGNGAVFNAGTLFTGDGKVQVTGNAAFNGAFTSHNLQLVSGTLTGTGALMNGAVNWTGGRLTGDWTVATGASMNLQPGGTKLIDGSVTNQGTMAATDHLYFQYNHSLTNEGVYTLQGDFGLINSYAGGNFVNTGTVVKNAGSGTSDVSTIAFVNAAGGVVDVQTGTIKLPTNFNNEGTLKGIGTYATNLLTNNGHVAPGESPGTLTLNGKFAQTAAGFFDVGLDGASFGQLLISGSAKLAGTIDAICMGSCNYDIGESWKIMDAGGGVSGTFASLVMSGFSSGAFSVDYSHANQVWLTVTEATVGAVPEPGTYALMLGGLAVVGWLARRKRA